MLLDALSTAEILMLHERAFAALDPIGKQRIIETARAHGWDRTWETELRAA